MGRWYIHSQKVIGAAADHYGWYDRACTTPVLPHPLINGSKTPHFTACWHDVPTFLRVQSVFGNDHSTTEMYCSLSLVDLQFQYFKSMKNMGGIEKNVKINWCGYTPRWKDLYNFISTPGLGNEAEVSHAWAGKQCSSSWVGLISAVAWALCLRDQA